MFREPALFRAAACAVTQAERHIAEAFIQITRQDFDVVFCNPLIFQLQFVAESLDLFSPDIPYGNRFAVIGPLDNL